MGVGGGDCNAQSTSRDSSGQGMSKLILYKSKGLTPALPPSQ